MDYTAAPKDSGADPRVHLGPLGLSWLSEGRPCGGGATHGAAERNWGTGSGITYIYNIIYILLYYIILCYVMLCYIILDYIILYYIILYIHISIFYVLIH